jgi:hypothetical protein
MRSFVCIKDELRGPQLNLRQLLTPLFYGGCAKPHPDSKRQRARRQRALAYAQARALKAQYVPLCRVAPVVVDDEWRTGFFDQHFHRVMLEARYGA